jgi:cellulose biosynthesis protein BcsQ
MHIQPLHLKQTRERLGLTIAEAAQSIHVDRRTWAAYEAPRDRKSTRGISAGALALFCIKHRLPFPPVRLDGTPTSGDTHIISIVSATGGCGKTYISLELGRLLAQDGYRSAVVTDADYLSQDNFQFDNPRVLRRSHVILNPSELTDLRHRLQAMGALAEDGTLRPERAFDCYFEAKEWQAKNKPDATLAELRTSTDFVFLDLGRDIETALLLSDLVIFVFDLERWDAPNSIRNVFSRRLAKHAEPGASPKLFTLFTNKKPGRWQTESGGYAAAHAFGLPLMHTTLSTAYAVERKKIEKRFWRDARLEEPRGKSELIADTAPSSVAALEYRSLATEIIHILNAQGACAR